MTGKKRFVVQDFVVHENKMWFISQIYNYLFALNTDTMEIVKFIRVPCYYPYSRYVMDAIEYSNGELILMPDKGKYIAGYKIEDEKFSLFPKDNCIYRRFNRPYTKKGGNLYTVSPSDNFVYKYSITDQSVKKIPVGGKSNKYVGIQYADDIFVLLLSGKAEVILWDEKRNQTESITRFPENYAAYSEKYYMADMAVIGHNVLVFPRYANMILKIDIKKKAVSQWLGVFDDYNPALGLMLFKCAKTVGNKIYAYNVYYEKWFIYDYEKESCDQCEMQIEDKKYEELTNSFMFELKNTEEVFFEREDAYMITLKRFIDSVNNSNRTERICDGGETYGSVIYEKLCNPGV